MNSIQPATQTNILTRSLMEHPYQQYCGLEIISQEVGTCRCRLVVTPAIDNLGHTLHGGVIYSIMDVTSMLATIPCLNSGEYALTSSFNANMLSPAPLGVTVEVEAQVVRFGKNMIFTRCDAYKITDNGDAKPIALSQIAKLRLTRNVA